MKLLRSAGLALLICAAASPGAAQEPAGGGPAVNRSVFATESILGVTAVTQVSGRGQNVTAAIVEFAPAVAASAIGPESFAIDGRTVLSARVAATPDLDAPSADGRFAILMLDPADEAPAVFAPGVDEAPQLVVHLAAPVALADGGTIGPTGTGVINTRVTNLIVDDFRQFRFTDPETGLLLDYNLYIPEGYDPAQSYPLVMFLHDAGVTGSNPRRTLQQGLGAVSFASPGDQARHPSFVLAPQFPVPLANDASQTSVYADLLPRLIDRVATDYAIDRDRIYATGQSGGCMTSLALGVSHPDLFAGTLCVAGQWDPAVVAPLADDNLWVIVSEDDDKAFPGMTAIMEVLEANGARVARGSLDARAAPGEQAGAVVAIRAGAEDSRVFFTTFTPGSVLPEDGSDAGGAGHVNTWIYAYDIAAVRDWLFEQRR